MSGAGEGRQVAEWWSPTPGSRVRIRISNEDRESIKFNMTRFDGCVGTVRGVHPHLGAARYTVYLDEPISNQSLVGSTSDHANFAAASLEPLAPA